ncbi:hypothetical protein AAC387_Pa01g0614 [Persea americana]
MPREETEADEESRLTRLEKEVDASQERNHFLELENEQLKQEIVRLKSQLASLRAQNADRKSALWKKVQNSINSSNAANQNPTIQTKIQEDVIAAADESLCMRLDSPEPPARGERAPRVPKPPPKPSSTSWISPHIANGMKAAPPPPPPPPPSKLHGGNAATIRRVPEVLELYRSLTRRDTRLDSGTGLSGTPVPMNTQNMIGEIENRSAYVMAIKSDIETKKEFIEYVTREVQNAAYKEISDVEAFVKWLDEELSYLVDERAVLKHFRQWPERKADAMREAAFSYRDLKNLEIEVSSFHDNPSQPTQLALKRIQALQEKLETGVYNIERVRDSSCKRFKEFQIPWDWMLDAGIVGQLKLSSMRLAKEYMKRVATELQSSTCTQEEDFMLQGVRFAFRVHQFVGGFNAESMQAFQELRKVGMSSPKGCHKQQSIVSTTEPVLERNT